MNTLNKTIFEDYFDSTLNRLKKVRLQVRQQNKLKILRFFYATLRFLSIYHCIRMRKDQKLIISGCGRSATQFTSLLFKELGVRIGHEKLEKNGIVSWTLVPNTHIKVWGPSYNSIKHAKMPIVHQVRHPLAVISSTVTVFSDKKSWDFIRRFVPIAESDSMILKAMKYWYYWNLLAEKKAVHTYKVENIEDEIDTLIGIGGFRITSEKANNFKSISTETHSRKHSKLGWDDLKKADLLLTEKIQELSKRYGYH